MKHQRLWGQAGVLALALIAAPTGALGQVGQDDIGEVGAFVGGTFGAGAHVAGGGSAGVAVSHHGMLVFETWFTPLGSHTIQPWPERSLVQRSRLWDFSLDAHIRIPVKKRWEPYAIVGSGLLWNQIRTQTVNANGITVIQGFSQFDGVFHTGGGVRYFIGRNWGIRPEIKAIITQHTFTRISIGVFYVTSAEPEWP